MRAVVRLTLKKERDAVKYNYCAKSDTNKQNFTTQYHNFFFKGKMKKEFLLRVVAKNGSGKNSIQPGVSGFRVG